MQRRDRSGDSKRRKTRRAPQIQHGPAQVRVAAETVRSHIRSCPSLALVLGSGFQPVISRLKVELRLPFHRIPGFPSAGVPGHTGDLLVGRLGNTPVAVLNGRAHYYEGHSMEAITLPIRVLAGLGVRAILLTNAAGGIGRHLRNGDFMVLTDHINLMGANPLRGPSWPGRSRFLDLTGVYDAGLSGLLRQAARQAKLRLRNGVYLAVSGPSYETPAEIRAFARLGADAVGMSTVPEAIVARHCGVRVAALSCVTNLAAGRALRPLSHREVLAAGRSVQEPVARLLEAFAELYATEVEKATHRGGH